MDTSFYSLLFSEVILIRAGRGLKLRIIDQPSPPSQQQNRPIHVSYSAYERLLHNLHHFVPNEDQWWSRGKAYVTELISPAMWGLMKVAGKRLYQVSSEHFESLWSSIAPEQRLIKTIFRGESLPHELHISERDPQLTFSSITEAARWLKNAVNTHNTSLLQSDEGETHSNHRRWGGARRVVGAMALDENLTMIAQAFNEPRKGHTAHAERSLLGSPKLLSQQHDKVSTVYLISTLKPCKMCAGLWFTYAQCQSLQVHYLRDDAGQNGQNTAFDHGSYAWGEANRWRWRTNDWSQEQLILG